MWTTDRKASAIQSAPAEQWVLGFLSDGGKTGTAKALDPAYGDVQAIWAWIDEYCGTHPNKDLADAGVAFYQTHPR